MIATAKNFDIMCFELRNHYPQLDSPLKKDVDVLLSEVKKIVTSEEHIKPALNNLLKDIFDLRIKAIKWLIGDSGFELSEMIDEVYPKFDEMRNNPKLEVLAENILFALRCNRKVVDAIIITPEFSQENIENSVSKLPSLTYEQFISAIALGVPDDSIAQKIVDWTNSSLYIEFIIFAAATIHDEHLNASERNINELSFIIADAAQEYSALATELGILKNRSSKQSSGQISFDKDFINEQKKLADLGLDDYYSNLPN